MISSPASIGAKRLNQRCAINRTTPRPESLVSIGHNALYVNDSSF